MPDFGAILPEWFKSGVALAPVTFVALLVVLVLAQVLPSSNAHTECHCRQQLSSLRCGP